MSDASSSLGPAFLGAFEGSISVLLTLFAGYYIGRLEILDHKAVRRISQLCSNLFLPCLILEQMGPELSASNIAKLWIIPVWGVLSTVLSHIVGWLGQKAFKTPYWVIVASGRPNSSALPLLLLQSLESTGILDSLGASGESPSKILHRAKSIILLNVVIQQSITFQIAPSVLRWDDGKQDDEEEGPEYLTPALGKSSSRLNPVIQDRERVGLLQNHDGISYGAGGQGEEEGDFLDALAGIEDQPDIHWPQSIGALEKPIKGTLNWMSAPLIAAIVALLIGIIPPLNEAFFAEDSALYSSVTQAVANLGELYVALQMFVVGTQLALLPSVRPSCKATTFSMLVRFVLMPGISLLFVWATAGRGWYVEDKLVWFLLVLIPSGPSAMVLANVSELVDVDQGPIAGYLTISYLFSPLMAVVTSLGLLVVDSASKRHS